MVFAALEKVNGSFSYRMIAEPTDKKTFGDLFSVCKNI
jgi:hypothetical protein